MNCIKEYIVEPIITIEKLYYAAVVTKLWIIIIIQWRDTYFSIFSVHLPARRYLISQEPQLWSCRIWQGLLRAECEDKILLPPQVLRVFLLIGSALSCENASAQSNLMKRSWSLCVSILLIMKILRHIQRHMTKRNTATSKTRGKRPWMAPQQKGKGWFLFTQIQTP